jgi:hypothetical protein
MKYLTGAPVAIPRTTDVPRHEHRFTREVERWTVRGKTFVRLECVCGDQVVEAA